MILRLPLEKLNSTPRPLAGTVPSEDLALDEVEGVRDAGDLRFDLQASLLGTEILVRGRLGLRLSFQCVRCLQFFPLDLAIPEFVRSFELEEIDDQLDLGPELREEILLTFPSFPQCSADCAGLCPLCGNNLNKQNCGCEAPPVEDRWQALDSLNLGENAQE